MFDLDSWQEIWSTISKNKTRSILTGFGIFWGIYMLLFLIGIGNGFQTGMLKEFQGFQMNSSFYWSNQTGEAYKGYKKGRYWEMQKKDVKLLKAKAQTIEYLSPILFLWTYGSNSNVFYQLKSGTYALKGVFSEYFNVEKQYLLKGRLFNEFDDEGQRKVCIIGKNVAETLFGNDIEPIGQLIKVQGIYFQVIGVVSAMSNATIGEKSDRSVFLPFPIMQTTFIKKDQIHLLVCTTKKGFPVSVTEDEVKNIIKDNHDIAPSDDKAIGSVNIEKQGKMFEGLLDGVSVIIWIVGLGALFTGVIGISNIMIVTIKERTREIGVRRALGAKPIAIMVQILSESFVLTSLAGILGFLAGVGTLVLIDSAMGEALQDVPLFGAPFVTFKVATIALLILIVSGVLAGILPAYRALKVKAIDAIRDE